MKMRAYVKIGLVGLALLTQGCAGTGGMVKVDAPPAPSAQEATVVFMRSSFLGGAISSSVWDVTGTEARFVGIVNTGSKVAYNVPAGEHTFMVVSEAADFLKATVTPGKTYYSLVTPRPGVWKARFSFRPVRLAELSGKEFQGWDSSTKYVKPGPDAEAWAKKNAASVEKARAEYWPEWNSKPQAQKDEQTLKPEDGR